MFSALLHKEWIKLRHYWWVPFILCAAALCDYWLTFKGVRAMHGAVVTWNGLISDNIIYFGYLKWAYLSSAIWLAAVQMLPECHDRRLRLLFHLPVDTACALGVMVMTGMGLMLLLIGSSLLAFCCINGIFGLPWELTNLMLLTILPWGLAGLVCWSAAAAAIADPQYMRKAVYVLVGLGYVYMLTGGRGYASMQESLGLYALIAIPWLLAPCVAALRVKEGN